MPLVGFALCLADYALTGLVTAALVGLQFRGHPDCRFFTLVGLYLWPVVWAFWAAFGSVLLVMAALFPLILLLRKERERTRRPPGEG